MERKRKNNIISLFMIFVLIFSLTASSLVMADPLDSDEQMDVIEEDQLMKGENPVLEEVDEEAPLDGEALKENPTVEETPILNESSDESPLPEEAKEDLLKELPEEKRETEDANSKKKAIDDGLEETVELEADFILDEGEEENNVSSLATSPTIPMENDYISIENYLDASGRSTNGHYRVVGMYITKGGDVHVLIDNDKKTADQTRFHSPKLNDQEAAGFTPEKDKNFEDYEKYWKEIGTSITLTFPDNPPKTIEGVRLFDFNFGQMKEHIKTNNKLQILNQAGGFSIMETFYIEHKTDVTIKKLITGNFGDLSREFSFTVAINDDPLESFELSHEGTHTIEELSSNDVITLTEASNGYEVIVMIGETSIIPDENDKYIIDLSEHDTDITITVTNHKDIPINTGVFTGTLPYIVILTFAIIALSAIIISRKKYELDNAGG